MRGQRPASPAQPPREKSFPRGYLFTADALLVILALITIYKSPRPISWEAEAFCVAAVTLAAVLALLAVWLGEEPAPRVGQLSNKVLRAGAGVMPNAKPPNQFRDEKAKPPHPQQ
jgi:hypothetical protein